MTPPTSTTPVVAPAGRHPGRAPRAALIGTVLEYYDLGIYATVAATVFGRVFFPGVSPALGTVQAIATFSAAYVVRPISGMVLGSLGDRIGRRKVLLGCLLLMGVATVGIGLVPSYAAVGWFAPLLLVLLRLCQGIGAGAEYSGAALLAVESAPGRKRGLFGAAPAAGASLGGVVATLMVLLVTGLTTDEQFLTWGWRLPFLFSAILVAYGLWLRTRLPETDDYARAQALGRTSSRPLSEVLRGHPRAVGAVMLIQFASAGLGFFFQVFVVGYATTQVGLVRSDVLVGLLLSQLACAAVSALAGLWADLWDPRLIIATGFVLAALVAFPFFALVQPGFPLGLWIGMLLGQGLAIGLVYGPFALFTVRLFPEHLRYAGTGTGREVGGSIGSAGVPLLAAQMVYLGGSGTTALSIMMIVIALVGLPGIVLARPAGGDPPDTSDPAPSASGPAVETGGAR